MGPRYAESVILNLTQTWEESDTRTPLICLLSMGSDPTNQIESLSKKCHLGIYISETLLNKKLVKLFYYNSKIYLTLTYQYHITVKVIVH